MTEPTINTAIQFYKNPPLFGGPIVSRGNGAGREIFVRSPGGKQIAATLVLGNAESADAIVWQDSGQFYAAAGVTVEGPRRIGERRRSRPKQIIREPITPVTTGPTGILFERILDYAGESPTVEYWVQIQDQPAVRLLSASMFADGPSPPGGGGPGGNLPDPPDEDNPGSPFNDPNLPYIIEPPASGIESQFYEVTIYLTAQRDGFNPDWAQIPGATDGFNWGNPTTSTVVGRVFLFGPIIGISPGVATQFGQEPQPENLEFGGQVAPNTNASTIHHADNQRTPGNSEVLSFTPDNLLDMINTSQNRIIDVGFVSIKPIPPGQDNPNPDEPPFPYGPDDGPPQPPLIIDYDPVNDPPPPPEEDPPPEDEKFDVRFNWPYLSILSKTKYLVQVLLRASDYSESGNIDAYAWQLDVRADGSIEAITQEKRTVSENDPINYGLLADFSQHLLVNANANEVPPIYEQHWEANPDSDGNYATLNLDETGRGVTVLGDDLQQWRQYLPNDQAFSVPGHRTKDGNSVTMIASYQDFGYADEIDAEDWMTVSSFKTYR